MKIDLHCHTKKVKKGDASTREVTKELFSQKVIESGVELIAITNHNLFDINQYNMFKETVEEYCEIWPGIELDVIGKQQKKGHVLVVCNPIEVDKFSDVTRNILGNMTYDNFCISIDNMIESFKSLDVIYIAHYYKDKELPHDDLEYFESKINNKYRLLKEPADLTTIGVLNCNQQRAIIGSDVKDWNNYEKSHFGELKFTIKGFTNFIKFLEKDIEIINDYIQGDFKEKVTVYGKSDTAEYPYSIPIYNDVNIIFGDKGSGKSEILNSLAKYYEEEKGIKPIHFRGGDKDDWFIKLLNNKDDSYINSIVFDDCKNELKGICDYLDVQPVFLTKYTEYYKHKSNNKKKEKMKVLEITKTNRFDTNLLDKLMKEYKSIAEFLNDFLNYEVVNKYEQECKIILEKLTFIKEKNYELILDEWYNQYSYKMVDSFIENMNRYVAECVGAPVLPTSTHFKEFTENRIKLWQNSNKILSVLNNKKTDVRKSYVGDVGEKGRGYLVVSTGLINRTNFDNYKNYLLATKFKISSKEFIDSLYKISIDIFDLNIPKLISDFSLFCLEKDISDISKFCFVRKEFHLNEDAYQPSKGEKAILALQYELYSHKNEDIFLIDEPELSLGSIYIEKNIVPLIKELGTSKKIVVIATHDGNIAVRTRPVNSILKLSDNGNYRTYIGSMFTGELVNIDDSEDKLNWKETSIKYLEGGMEAYEERGYLYE